MCYADGLVELASFVCVAHACVILVPHLVILRDEGLLQLLRYTSNLLSLQPRATASNTAEAKVRNRRREEEGGQLGREADRGRVGDQARKGMEDRGGGTEPVTLSAGKGQAKGRSMRLRNSRRH